MYGTYMYSCGVVHHVILITQYRTGSCLPHVVDVDWRLDYHIKVSGVEAWQREERNRKDEERGEKG